MRLLWYSFTCAATLLGVILAGTDRAAHALPAAGADVLPVAAVVGVMPAEGSIALTGWMQVERGPPRVESGVAVSDLEIVALVLTGAGPLGLISVSERPNDGSSYVSAGELRSLQPGTDFPASSFFDLFIDVALPDSVFGPFFLHNEAPLRLVPLAGPLVAWPPLGVTYVLQPAEGPACIPLVGFDNQPVELDFCLRDLSLEIAPERPSYSVARGGPSPLHPADIYALTPNDVSGSDQAPFLRIPCAGLGLSADGCDDGADGDRDDLDALSYGADLPPGEAPGVSFSVGAGAQGVAGSAVAAQGACPPAQPGASPEPEPDEFHSALDGTNEHVLDGNGPVGACAPAFPLGLVEGATVRDDLDALYRHDSADVDGDGDGVPERPVYFSLDAASPSLAALDVSAADVLQTVSGSAPTMYASAATLGLEEGDDLDALCLRESGDGVYGAGDVLYFSLAPGSPTLARIDAGPGDILAPGDMPTIVRSAGALGLLSDDDVNALACQALVAQRQSTGDVDCDGAATSIDAALILQLAAGLVDALPCIENGDTNEDSVIDSMDAQLVLQLHAGLIDRLPLP